MAPRRPVARRRAVSRPRSKAPLLSKSPPQPTPPPPPSPPNIFFKTEDLPLTGVSDISSNARNSVPLSLKEGAQIPLPGSRSGSSYRGSTSYFVSPGPAPPLGFRYQEYDAVEHRIQIRGSLAFILDDEEALIPLPPSRYGSSSHHSSPYFASPGPGAPTDEKMYQIKRDSSLSEYSADGDVHHVEREERLAPIPEDLMDDEMDNEMHQIKEESLSAYSADDDVHHVEREERLVPIPEDARAGEMREIEMQDPPALVSERWAVDMGRRA